MRLQDAARRRFLKLQQDQREMELRRLEDEIERKIQMRDQEIAATAEDLEIRHLELESQKRLYEKDLTGNQDSVAKEIRKDADAHRQKVALEEHMFRNLLETSQMEGRRTQRVRACGTWGPGAQSCPSENTHLQVFHLFCLPQFLGAAGLCVYGLLTGLASLI
ncbi:TBC1 domain family member 31 isoform X1 [Cricetulus griseus]|uniref:WD repeat-containing protein 67 n=1 Tax=Cricetulus griseus TaxID=10029 RepID=G3IP37_CRIGR|nr:TBC1 domain family member 31 isoform X1 [Cricetulus griseus]EGV91548.1 WD repeat-containing protein 67 [Cricetulus griseus]